MNKYHKPALNDEQITELVKERRQHTPWQELTEYFERSENVLRGYIRKAAKLEIITKKECKSLINSPKLTDELAKEIIEERKKGVFREKIIEDYGISRTTFQKAMNRGVKIRYITKQEKIDLTSGFSSLSFEGKVQKHGEKQAKKMQSDIWDKGMGSDHERLVEIARKGGLATQKSSPHVIENLKNGEDYGQYPRLTYNKIEFRSKGELWLGLMLKEKGCFKTISGKCHQISCGNYTIDYIIKSNNKDAAIEYHPNPKGMDDGNYELRRIQNLHMAGFHGKVIVLEKYRDFYLKGLSNFSEYLKLNRKVNEKLEKIVELSKVPF
jgi:hypothetical protein